MWLFVFTSFLIHQQLFQGYIKLSILYDAELLSDYHQRKKTIISHLSVVLVFYLPIKQNYRNNKRSCLLGFEIVLFDKFQKLYF